MSKRKLVTGHVALSVWICLFWMGAGCRQAQAPSKGGPLIGITSDYEPAKGERSALTTAGFAYVRAVAANGGVPVVLPAVDDERVLQKYLSTLDGLVIIGGDDIPPAVYGEQPDKTVVPLTKERYEFERKLIARWLTSGKPLLGVCLGMQFTNVVSGGTMIQDIPSEVGKQVNHKAYHRVQIEPGSALAKLLGTTEASVLSSHHQAVEKLGEGLKPVAHSEDGIVEALERTDGKFGLFVQWHPESMKDTAHRNAIYGALIQAATAKK